MFVKGQFLIDEVVSNLKCCSRKRGRFSGGYCSRRAGLVGLLVDIALQYLSYPRPENKACGLVRRIKNVFDSWLKDLTDFDWNGCPSVLK